MNSRKRASSVAGFQASKKQRLPQTCEWIRKEPLYRAWKAWEESTAPTLWIHGPPGCGKSFLAQSIIEDLHGTDDKSAVLSHFCDATTTPSSALAALLAQLLSKPVASDLKDDITKIVNDLSSHNVSSPSDDAGYKLWDGVLAVVEKAPALTIIVDGLDELPVKHLAPQQFDFPSRFVELTTLLGGYVRILVLSRTNAHIQRVFHDSPQIQITPARVRDDIEKYTSSEMDKYSNLTSIKKDIQESLIQQSEGIFLWVSLSLQALAAETSLERVLEKLESLPPSLHGLYAALLDKSSTELTAGQTTIRDLILRWVLLSVRPLRTIEIANALAVETLAFIPDPEKKALELCGSLVKVEDGILKLFHHSLRDYLLSDYPGLSNSADANLLISKALLSYLDRPELVQMKECLSSAEFEQTYPLAEYATLYWVHHVTQSKPEARLQEDIISFFRGPNAQGWFDRLLPHFLHRSVLSVPPRLPINARFFHLSMLKSTLVKYFGEGSKLEVDSLISDCLRKTYEGQLRKARGADAPQALTLKRLLELGELYTWLPSLQAKSRALFEEAVDLSAHQAPSVETRCLRLTALQVLSDTLKREGKYSDARALLEKLIEAGKYDVPESRLNLMFAYDSSGWLSMRLGQLDEAVAYLQNALGIATELFGSRSPFTLRSKVTLAEVLGRLGRHEEAEELCKSLEEQLRQHQRDSTALHKDCVSQLNTLAAIYMQRGKYDDARATYDVVAKDRASVFGPDHQLTLWAEMQLGVAMMKAGDRVGAGRLLQKLLPRQTAVLGAEHQDVKDVTELVGQLLA